jgi:hypothetical protein
MPRIPRRSKRAEDAAPHPDDRQGEAGEQATTEAPAAADAADAPTVVAPAAGTLPASEQPTTEGDAGAEAAGGAGGEAAPDAGTAAALAAAAEPETAPADVRPRFRERTRMRRRLRYLRRLRELAFRDLGGLVFDLHRFGRRRDELVMQKLEALLAIDHELRTLEDVLGDRREFTELREAGISACTTCGTLHDTDANFCPGCGTSLRGGVAGGTPDAPAEAGDGGAGQAATGVAQQDAAQEGAAGQEQRSPAPS